MTHEQWLEKKEEDRLKLEEDMKNQANENDGAAPKKGFIHNLDFESWTEMKIHQTKKKKMQEKEEKEKYQAWLDQRK